MRILKEFSGKNAVESMKGLFLDSYLSNPCWNLKNIQLFSKLPD